MTDAQITEPPAVIEGQVVENGAGPVGTDVVRPAALFETNDPVAIVRRTGEIANTLKDFLRAQDLTTRISGKDHVQVGGWQCLGMMFGVTAVVTSSEPVENGWEARAELRDSTGRVIGAADSQCLTTEKRGPWKSADDYAVRSMAQTRAVGKAFRTVFGFIAEAAGYSPVPAEEAVDDGPVGQVVAPAEPLPATILDELRTAYNHAPTNQKQFVMKLRAMNIAAPMRWSKIQAALTVDQAVEIIAWLSSEADRAAA